MSQINLIPREERLVFPQQLIFLGLLFLAAVLLGGQLLSSQAQAIADLEAEKSAQEQLLSQPAYRLLEEYQRCEQQVGQLKQAREQLAAKKQGYWADMALLTSLAAEIPGIDIRMLEAQLANEQFIALELTAASLAKAAAYLEQVSQLPSYSRVTVLKGEQGRMEQVYYLSVLVWRQDSHA